MEEKKYQIYKTFALWDQVGLDYANSTSLSRMYREETSPEQARQDAMEWWEAFIKLPHGHRKEEGPSLVEIGVDLLKLECWLFEKETWCLHWFNHHTYNIHLSDDELFKSFDEFCYRKRVANMKAGHHNNDWSEHGEKGKYYCLMGAEQRWRWKGPCHCEHCEKAGLTRIDH